MNSQDAPAQLAFVAQAGRLRRALGRPPRAATAGHPQAWCAVGPVERPREPPERVAYFADVVLAFATVDVLVEEVLRDGARRRTRVGHRLYALASPRGHLGIGRFLLSAPRQDNPARGRAALVDAARRATLAAHTTCKPELALDDLTCELGMLCSVLSTPEGTIRGLFRAESATYQARWWRRHGTARTPA